MTDAYAAPSDRSAAPAGDEPLVYDLAVGGARVGTRTVSVRYAGERRIVEVLTDVEIAGMRSRSRSTGVFGPRSNGFTTVVEDSAGRMTVQGAQIAPGRWRLVTTDAAGARERVVDALLTSLHLHDPDASRFLTAGGTVAMLIVETGEVVRGAASAPVEGSVTIGDAPVRVSEVRLQADAGLVSGRFALDGEGNVLRSELGAAGAVLVATARAAPSPRSFGAVETIEALSSGASEEAL